MRKPLIDSSSDHDRQSKRHHKAWLLASLVAAATLLLPLTTLVESSDKKPSPDPHQEISPMGSIMRGDRPAPSYDEVFKGGLRPPRRAPLGLQGNDILVNDPMAIDYQSENAIAKNGNYVVIGYNDVRGWYLATGVSICGYSYSSDGGMTWTDGGQMPTYGTGDAVYGDPDVKTWTDPNTSQIYFFYTTIYLDVNGDRTIAFHVSTDGGATWALPRSVTTATSSSDHADKEFLCVDPETGRIFVSWTNFGSGTTMRVSYSDDFGLTWDGLESFGSSGQGSIPRADGSSDMVYMAWRRSGDIQLAVSSNNGASWSGPDRIIDDLTNPMNPYGSDRIHGFPGMDVDHSNGNVYIVYASRDDAPDFSDIYFTRSTDEGDHWSNPVALNAWPGDDRSQFFPWVSVDQSDGRIDVIWYDQIGGTGTSDLTEIMHTHSNDGGLSWSCPTPLTDEPFHAEYGNTRSQPNIGDYIQCVSDNGFLYAAFAKTDEPSYLTYAPDTYIDASIGTGAHAPITFVSTSISDAGCVTGNGMAESWETIDLTVTVKNYSTCTSSITGMNGTLTTTTPGVTITTPFQSFGNLSGVGSIAFNTSPFVLELDPAFDSGEDIDLLLTLNSSAGPALVRFDLATGDPVETTLLTEDFDGVSAPALPAGWSSDHVDGTGTLNPWKTSTTYSESGPNSAFCANISSTSHNRLQSPSIVIPAGADLVDVTFDVTHDTEDDYERKVWDGALLRVEVDGGMAVTTVLAGAFASLFEPFYPWQMNRQSRSDQPLEDLSCWGDKTTPNFSPVHLQFPGLAGTTIRLFWDMGTDDGTGTSTGMFVDNVVVKSIEKPSVCTDPPAMAAAPSPVEFWGVPVNETTCDSILIINEGPSALAITGISGCMTTWFSIDTSMTSHSIDPGDTTTMLVCVTPDKTSPHSCTVTINSNATNSPTVIAVTVNSVTAIGPGDLPGAFEILGVSPNPFNPSTIVRFTLPSAMPVTAEVVAVNGARVRSLAVDKPFERGENHLEWDGRNDRGYPVASGVYFVRVQTPVGTRIARAVLLK